MSVMLGTIDFTQIKQFEPVPAGEYDGQTKDWEPKPNKDGKGMHVLARFVFPYTETDPETGQSRSVNKVVFTRWPITAANGLWRTQRDLVALGADPKSVSGKDANVEAVLNEIFGAVPTAVRLSLSINEYTDENTGETRRNNQVESVKRIG